MANMDKALTVHSKEALVEKDGWSKASEPVSEALPTHEAVGSGEVRRGAGKRREDSCWAAGEELGRTNHSLLGSATDMSRPHLKSEGICLQDFSFPLFHMGSVLAREK